MNPSDHVVIDAAIKAKQLQQKAAGKPPVAPKQASMASRSAAIGICVLAVASVAALALGN